MNRHISTLTVFKKYGGGVKDRIQCLVKGEESIDALVLKCTEHSYDAPNEKYIRAVVDVTFGVRSGNLTRFVELITSRLHVRDWRVVLKALYVLHHVLSEGATQVLVLLAQSSDLFVLPDKKIDTSQRARRQLQFARQYATFLEEAIVCFERSGVRLRSQEPSSLSDPLPPGAVDEATLSLHLGLAESLQDLLDAICKIDFSADVVDTSITRIIFDHLLDDASRLFVQMTETLLKLVDEEIQLPQACSSRIRELFQKYRTIVTRLNGHFATARKILGRGASLRELPTAVFERIESQFGHRRQTLSSHEFATLNLSGDLSVEAQGSGSAGPATVPAAAPKQQNVSSLDDLLG